MTVFDAIILGLLQGLTEFLPVSSSGHLVIAQALLGISSSGVLFEIVVHCGSLLAILVYFRKRIKGLFQSLTDKSRIDDRRMVRQLAYGSLPAVVAVILFKDYFEASYNDPRLTSMMLMVTGAILLLTRVTVKGTKDIKTIRAFLMGLGQALAVMSGISRSGSTIATGMIAKVEPAKAAEFSFLLAVPAIVGALVYKLDELSKLDPSLFLIYFISFVVTFFSSLFAVYLVLTVIKKGKFGYFAYYCFAVGLFGLYLFK